MEKDIPFRFDVSFDEMGLRPTSDPHLYLGKVRVFYKYSNRNGSYITDEYAEKLSQSAYMKPVFGYYDAPMGDFLGHEGPQKAKAYGFVLPNSLEWTEHFDEDGVVRTYATYEVLLWAKYWTEAKTIIQKTQSMEIDPDTIKGEWRLMENSEFKEYVYTEGIMSGLCILGDMKTPCFEGAAFFSMEDDSYVEFTQAIKNYFSYGGKNAMHITIAGLEHANFEAIWSALNPNFNEEGSYSIEVVPCDIDDNFVYAFACGKKRKAQKYSYSFEEEQLNIELVEEIDYDETVSNFTEQISAEKAKFDEAVANYEELQNRYNALNEELAALQAQFNELKEQHDSLQTVFKEKQQQIESKDSTISQQAAVIGEYENKEKEAIINKFAACLPTEVVQTIVDKKDSLSVKELNTEFALEYTKFSMAKEPANEIRIPAPKLEDDPELKSNAALAKILKAYKK